MIIMKRKLQLVVVFVALACCCREALANPAANRLFEDLLSGYNKLIRPVYFNNQTLVVSFKLRLSQLLDVHEKNQIMTTNVWLQHRWTDYKLTWLPEEYGGVDVLYVPSDMIWLPDIVLYNNADGNYQITIMTKAKVYPNGTVIWTPPAKYKSMCQIKVEFFPFDAQVCEMKFGSWTYGGREVDLQHLDKGVERVENVTSLRSVPHESARLIVDKGVDLSDYYKSVEWSILRVPAIRHEKRYPCCSSPFIDITCEIHLRRKTLFYTVNLIIPSVGISFLTALVFYLPSDSGEKISLCISILVSLTVFFLLLVEIIPSTSLVIPLIGKYLLFTMVLVTLSVVVTVISLNVHYRSPTTHTMPNWVKRLFLRKLPRILLMRRPTAAEPKQPAAEPNRSPADKKSAASNRCAELISAEMLSPNYQPALRLSAKEAIIDNFFRRSSNQNIQKSSSSSMKTAVDSVAYIADHLKNAERDDEVVEDWKFVALVLDRIFLWLFTISCLVGTARIIFWAPTIYDPTPAIA